MKQKDIAILIAVAAFAAIISFVLSNFIFASPQNREQQVEHMDAISAQFPMPPNEKYFNDQAVNPAKLIEVGGNNQNPFNKSGQ